MQTLLSLTSDAVVVMSFQNGCGASIHVDDSRQRCLRLKKLLVHFFYTRNQTLKATGVRRKVLIRLCVKYEQGWDPSFRSTLKPRPRENELQQLYLVGIDTKIAVLSKVFVSDTSCSGEKHNK